jgi:hypothetical protein
MPVMRRREKGEGRRERGEEGILEYLILVKYIS